MGEREQSEANLKTVNEFRSIDRPDEVLITHKSETGEEPVYVEQETLVSEEKIHHGQVQAEQSTHRLDDLVHNFLMFSLAPVYLTCLWDRSKNQIKFDLIYRFFDEMRISHPPRIIHYLGGADVFSRFAGGIWDRFLQGMPKVDNYEILFPRWVEQLVFVDRESRPMSYWRVNARKINVYSPSLVARPVEITVFVPTGVDSRLEPVAQKDGTVSCAKHKPEEWVVEEAMRYFGGIDL